MDTNQVFPDNSYVQGESVSGLPFLNGGMQAMTTVENTRRLQLERHLDFLEQGNRSWLDRLFLSKEERSLLRMVQQYKTEGRESRIGQSCN